ncbi:hypothetical protein [Diaphorobacter caeni]|uniref:hypothetical protein n=1 Tax=Diaphorobacter caeni TaxID=2784387 RepID=UPI00188E8DD7|nr:hypothetical protein [Diaphorobacter caeni]MBF5007243.1 hypothetical protein [Diaphorobacter caeni]
MDKEFLNHILVQADVLQTGCGCFDGQEVTGELEYIREAEAMLHLTASGLSSHDAVEQAFGPRWDAANTSATQRTAQLVELTELFDSQKRLEAFRQILPQLPEGGMDATTMNLLLWQADLMGTCCNVQEGMSDEYGSEADEIVALLASGIDFPQALNQVFDGRFWSGCLQSESRLPDVQSLIGKVQALIR